MKKRIVPQPVKKGKKAKVPFIMQMEAMECGAASMGMVLAYYEKWVPLEQLRMDCGVSRDGSSARNLLRAAKHYGLDCEGFRLEPEMLRDNGIFPCIVHMNFTHFMVVTGMKGEKVYLNDPAQGKIQMLNVVLMFAYFFLIWNYSPILTCIGLTGLLVNAGISRLMMNRRMDILRRQQRDSGRQESSTLSGISMMDTIKASGAENGFFTKWSGYQAAMLESSNRAWKSTLWVDNLTTIISKMIDLFILGTGAFLTFQGHFTVGMLMAFQGLLTQFSSPVLELIYAGHSLQEMRVEMERVNDILKYRADEKEQRGKETVLEGDEQKLSGTLEMNHVSFVYSPLGEPMLKDISFSLKPGKRIALVGTSGCGKSTVAKLLAGLYKPWSGEILYDGCPIQDIPRTLFGGSVAVVDQNVILFRDTIRNNIKMWDSSIEDFEMILAARDAGLHGDIMQRKGGYDSMLIENGKDLSGGQRQRMEIARVLAQDPTLLIMDEATSALDARTEYEVMNAVRDRGIACVIIAHRLSTIRHCDRIIMLDKGRIIEDGTYDELIQMNGEFARFVERQRI